MILYTMIITINNNSITINSNKRKSFSTGEYIDTTTKITKVIAYISAPISEELETPLTEEQRVVQLVKNTYGTDQGVSFNIVNKTGNIYNVSVTDNTTTTALKWYTVNMSTEAVTQS